MQPSPVFPNYSIFLEISPLIALLFLLCPRAWVREVFRTRLPELGGLYDRGQNLVNPSHQLLADRRPRSGLRLHRPTRLGLQKTARYDRQRPVDRSGSWAGPGPLGFTSF